MEKNKGLWISLGILLVVVLIVGGYLVSNWPKGGESTQADLPEPTQEMIDTVGYLEGMGTELDEGMKWTWPDDNDKFDPDYSGTKIVVEGGVYHITELWYDGVQYSTDAFDVAQAAEEEATATPTLEPTAVVNTVPAATSIPPTATSAPADLPYITAGSSEATQGQEVALTYHVPEGWECKKEIDGIVEKVQDGKTTFAVVESSANYGVMVCSAGDVVGEKIFGPYITMVYPTATSEAEADTAPSCVLDTFDEAARFGVQLAVDQLVDSDWEFDPENAARVAGDTTHPELASDESLAGCPMLIEGRKVLTEEHHIWLIAQGDTQYLDDGIFYAKEFSAWAYPSGWNMEDFSDQEYPPIAAEFVDAKRHNMQENGYDWPIFVHLSSGNTMEFEKGVEVGVDLPNNCDFADPTVLSVTGVYDSETSSFNASIGAEACWTAANIDGEWVKWFNAKDNVEFSTISAWLMPDAYEAADVDDWIKTQ